MLAPILNWILRLNSDDEIQSSTRIVYTTRAKSEIYCQNIASTSRGTSGSWPTAFGKCEMAHPSCFSAWGKDPAPRSPQQGGPRDVWRCTKSQYEPSRPQRFRHFKDVSCCCTSTWEPGYDLDLTWRNPPFFRTYPLVIQCSYGKAPCVGKIH